MHSLLQQSRAHWSDALGTYHQHVLVTHKHSAILITCLVYNQHSDVVIAATQQGMLNVFPIRQVHENLNPIHSVHSIHAHPSAVYCMVTDNNDLLATGGQQHRGDTQAAVKVWSIKTLTSRKEKDCIPLVCFSCPLSIPVSVSLSSLRASALVFLQSSSSIVLVTSHDNGLLLMWEMPHDVHGHCSTSFSSPLCRLSTPCYSVSSLVAVTGSSIVCGCSDGLLRVLDVSKENCSIMITQTIDPWESSTSTSIADKFHMPTRPSIRSLSYSPSSHLLICLFSNNHLLSLFYPSFIKADQTTLSFPASLVHHPYVCSSTSSVVRRIDRLLLDEPVNLSSTGCSGVYACCIYAGSRGSVDDILFVAGIGRAVCAYMLDGAMQINKLLCD